jgi:hypothetical protein
MADLTDADKAAVAAPEASQIKLSPASAGLFFSSMGETLLFVSLWAR